jgi:1-aminocyclopropane-1-carboxylate synthase
MCRRNAGFFIFIDLSPWLRIKDEDGEEKKKLAEQALAQRILEGGVSVQPGEEHFDRPGWFRIVFSYEREVLKVGLKRYVTLLSFM